MEKQKREDKEAKEMEARRKRIVANAKASAKRKPAVAKKGRKRNTRRRGRHSMGMHRMMRR